MNKIKIGYFADGPWSHRAFEQLIQDDSIEIVFIVPRSDTKDLNLLNYSKKYNIDYLCPIKVNSDDFYKRAKEYNCDLFVSMSFNQIFKERIFNLPRLKTINCHAGKLPFYRGRNILNWVLINDENEFGITVHFVDMGIDTGDIILQRSFQINDKHSYKSLLEISHKECAKILYDAIKLIQNSTYSVQKQSEIHPVGFYCGRRVEGDEVLNWNQTSRQIFNFIRAICAPGPQARSFINGIEIKINNSQLIKEAPNYIGTPGQIIAKTDKGFLVKTLDSFLEIFEVESNFTLKVGDKLKSYE